MADFEGVSVQGTPAGSRTSALALSILAGCVRRGGPTSAEYPQLAAALSVLCIDKVAPEQVSEVIGPTLTPDHLHGWAYLRPYGVIGDHALIDRILTRDVSSDPRIAAWDEFFQAQPAAQAVRNRRAYFHDLLARLDARKPLGATVLVIGCGAGREVHEYLTLHTESRLLVTCVDGDAQAAALADARLRGLRQPVTVLQQEPRALRLRGPFDLVWAPAHGTCLDDRHWVAVASRLYALVAPGGEAVFGNISAANPSRATSRSSRAGSWPTGPPPTSPRWRTRRPAPRRSCGSNARRSALICSRGWPAGADRAGHFTPSSPWIVAVDGPRLPCSSAATRST
jgi:extracellular factor (EF) 3-hydroxypalmitic acid methyl ester biosynthesis protein